MITTSYSTVIDHRLDKTWALLRDFNNYPVYIEGAHSDDRRSLTYAGLAPFAYPDGVVAERPPPAAYEGTIRVLPVVDGDRTYIRGAHRSRRRRRDDRTRRLRSSRARPHSHHSAAAARTQAAVSEPPIDDEQHTLTIVQLDMLREDYEAEHTLTQEANKALRDALADLKATQAAHAASAETATVEMPQQAEAEATETQQTRRLRSSR